MKLNFQNDRGSRSQSARSDLSGLTSAAARQSSGIALIVTLILLSVTLIMALAFLAISSRERGSVTTESDTATARLAADAALAHAEAQIMANILSTTNPYSFSLLVSTNYINPIGFQSGVSSFTNVNYVLPNGAPIIDNDFLQNLTNLLYLPRAPVYFPHSGGGSNEFRFFLNLNRNLDANGYPRFDPNGVVTEVDNNNNIIGTNFNEVGDPEWIGGLERPDVSHGPNNRFLYRYAFIAVPVGNGLDANYIHNQVFDESLGNPISVNPNSANSDVFFRNQGVGSWEINLAAFLADLNTNKWATYNYFEPAFPNTGVAFDDARALLSYRYANNYASLASVQNLFGNAGATAFQNDRIDGYSDGPLQTNTVLPFENDNAGLPWAGADNTNHFFTPGEFFDPTKTAGFSTNLLNAGTNNSSYDRYTFYRMLSQLGTDSSAESGKINLNYSNAIAQFDANGALTNISIIPGAETNLTPWTPFQFFTIAADKMLRDYTTFWRQGDPTNFVATFYSVTNFTPIAANYNLMTNYPAFGITRIPVLVSNQFVYTPAVQRLLQLAANIYDATTNNTFALGNNFPSRFRPLFDRDVNGNVFVVGYVQQTDLINQATEFSNPELAPPVDASDLPIGLGTNILENVYGVPWILGAKKGFPNFNEYSTENAVWLTRKIQVTRNTNSVPYQFATNQMYVMAISNWFGVECWNSYRANYQGPVEMMVRHSVNMTLTNYDYNMTYENASNTYETFTYPQPNTWQGYQISPGLSFLTPMNTNITLFPGSSIYVYNVPSVSYFMPVPTNGLNYLDKGILPFPHFGLLITNRLQVVIIDYSAGPSSGQIVDYVQLNGLDTSRPDLSSEIADNPPNPGPSDGDFWDITTNGGQPQGVINQYYYSRNGGTLPKDDGDAGQWSKDPIPGLNFISDAAERAYFQLFFTTLASKTYTDPNGKKGTIQNTSTNVQEPFTPTRISVKDYSWQANDPLVHYLASDLERTGGINNQQHTLSWPSSAPFSLGALNERYMPWGGHLPINLNAPDFNATNAYNLALKDPSVTSSDNWDFPTNKYPTVGWLGRVHRGTPWQTVYLKANNILTDNNGINIWVTWSGNQNLFDSDNTAPAQDHLLFDIFTTAFNDNATRGQLSVNIPSPNLAAWSALFSGIAVPTTITNTYTVIQPAAVESTVNLTPVTNTAVYRLALAIDQTRSTFTNADGLPHVFEHVGDILAVPQLTEQTPFLAPPYSPSLPGPNPQNAISDEMYEWLPQQTMSLLRVGSPRYVIYSYGQALKPAPNSIVTGGTFFGMVTNYQVMAETATRAVVRFDSMLTNNPDGSLTITNNNAVIESFNILPPDQN